MNVTQKELRKFVKNIILLSSVTEKKLDKDGLYYILYSPFIYNAIEGCKESKDFFLGVLYKKLKISKSDYMGVMKLSMSDSYLPDIKYFLAIHKYLPQYKENFQHWLNLLYFSTVHFQYMRNANDEFELFEKNKKYIYPNSLNINNIVLPLHFLFDLSVEYLLGAHKEKEMVVGNNIILMLLSDYKDILLSRRKKDYIYSLDEAKKNMEYIEQLTGMTQRELFALDFHLLIARNYNYYCSNHLGNIT